MIESWIAQYEPKNEEELVNALREIMQEITLAGLSRTDFYEKAAFYGRTALRIFYNLDRFSEDMDFSLLETNTSFSLKPYFTAILNEFEAIGLSVSIKEKAKNTTSAIESAFLKSDTIRKTLPLDEIPSYQGLNVNKSIKIKLEIDREPPLGFETEQKLLLRPFSFYVNCVSQSDLFAGKLHALLFRKWKNRVKGRDWYDFEWYVQNSIALNVNHFLHRTLDSGDWKAASISPEQIKDLVHQRVDSISFKQAKEDIIRFIPDDEKIKIWSPKYFHDLVERMEIKE